MVIQKIWMDLKAKEINKREIKQIKYVANYVLSTDFGTKGYQLSLLKENLQQLKKVELKRKITKKTLIT